MVSQNTAETRFTITIKIHKTSLYDHLGIEIT